MCVHAQPDMQTIHEAIKIVNHLNYYLLHITPGLMTRSNMHYNLSQTILLLAFAALWSCLH